MTVGVLPRSTVHDWTPRDSLGVAAVTRTRTAALDDPATSALPTNTAVSVCAPTPRSRGRSRRAVPRRPSTTTSPDATTVSPSRISTVPVGEPALAVTATVARLASPNSTERSATPSVVVDVACAMPTLTGADVDACHAVDVGSNRAVRVWFPPPSRTLVVAVPSTTSASPSAVCPSRKVTVPVAPAGSTEAVRVSWEPTRRAPVTPRVVVVGSETGASTGTTWARETVVALCVCRTSRSDGSSAGSAVRCTVTGAPAVASNSSASREPPPSNQYSGAYGSAVNGSTRSTSAVPSVA